jgi:hypothetical protein
MYQKISKWNTVLEIACLLFFHLIFLLNTYIYYKSFLKGGYDFFEFLQTIIFKLALISSPIIVLARIYLVKLITPIAESIPNEEEVIIIRGENKLDILQIKKSDLVCVSNSQNYVEIFFVEEGKLKTKLIRSTLKKIESDFSFLVQIHRSHLINPSHFMCWKNQDTISLTQIELPVSKNYRKQLLFT